MKAESVQEDLAAEQQSPQQYLAVERQSPGQYLEEQREQVNDNWNNYSPLFSK